MGVTFEVAGRKYEIADPQATILAENLRVLSQAELRGPLRAAVRLEPDDEWRQGAQSLADSIESALVAERSQPLHLDGDAADATYCVLRLMVGLDSEGAAAAGLRDALGTPVAPEPATRPPRTGATLRYLSRPEMVELLVILFVLAVLTVVLGFAWTGTWWVLAPVDRGADRPPCRDHADERPLRMVGRVGRLVRSAARARGRARHARRAAGRNDPRRLTAGRAG